MELQATDRTVFGKKVRALRAQGFLPGEVYGHGTENRHIAVLEKDFTKLYHTAGESTVIQLVLNGKKIPVLVAAVERDHTKDELLAVDFHEIKKGELVQVKVPVKLTGIAPAVKLGKVVVQVLHEIEIEADPDAIPHSFDADVSALEHEGQNIHAASITIPDGVKILTHGDVVVATVVGQRKEEEAPVAAPAAETVSETAPAAQPQSEAQGKK
jgi:large subunit ribosomal protein L25